VQKANRPDVRTAPNGVFGSGLTLMDLFVVLAASVTFLTAVAAHHAHGEGKGRPVDLAAHDLGITPEQFNAALNKVPAPPRGQRPTEAYKKQFATALNVSVEKLDIVMEKYRPLKRMRHLAHPADVGSG
jgi:hypothetical protein